MLAHIAEDEFVTKTQIFRFLLDDFFARYSHKLLER